jgi:adenosylcobinamide-GDP ribazoletransferase
VPVQLAQFDPAWLTACVRHFPLIGAGVGAVGAAVLLGAAAWWPPAVAAVLALAATVALTGGFHEDGLADTLDALQASQPGEWFLVIGQDQYAHLSSWRRVDALLAACTLAVVGRGDAAVAPDPALPPHRAVHLHLPADAVSASGVRAAVAQGADISPLVGNEVARYIAQHSLYIA